ncbi:DUF805 domain-containing protein [Parasphingopyxis marina]|uniref:DUF805 domain-containing protein n=1 Tax=Parasphingopyxis marina TaxID=2761622 RepID=A0A842HYX7_9SPHN|nr:DUF805 domain-containing protein [Parasphingopyxis marina]MBC2777559.1 DUF805 domain-containing protein [Parasphingopyxis marina]
MEYMLMPLRRYADFEGRSRRTEYWMFVLFYVILFVAAFVVGMILDAILGSMSGGGMGIITMILVIGLALALFVPSLAVQVRRFHDQDKSGWFVLLGFIPYVGGIIVLVFMCLDGTPGPNRFGPDPKERGNADVFS